MVSRLPSTQAKENRGGSGGGGEVTKATLRRGGVVSRLPSYRGKRGRGWGEGNTDNTKVGWGGEQVTMLGRQKGVGVTKATLRWGGVVSRLQSYTGKRGVGGGVTKETLRDPGKTRDKTLKAN